jgi:peptidoglycan/LPS O-acetylase OafA/YrhL
VLAATLQIILALNIQLNNIAGNIIYYLLAITTTVLVASISYEFYEKRFIKAKVHYSEIVSGENAKEEEPEPSVKTEAVAG